MRFAGNVSRMNEVKNEYKILVKKSEGKRLLDNLPVAQY
jgi:hypothetical protein